MKQLGGNWFPDHEQHMGEWMKAPKNKIIIDGRQTYQYRKQIAALGYVKNWRTAVDVGGHVGLWSVHLAKLFQSVHAFEPVAEHRACFVKNVPFVQCDPPREYETSEAKIVTLHACALGAQAGEVAMWSEPGSSGNSQVRGAGDIPLRTLDSFELQEVDFLKIDCEGYELYVLQGAVDTLERCRPTICVEQKPHIIGNFGFTGPEAVRFLEARGAVVFQEYSGDYMMGWK